ncbi:PA2169 family four-helix-bundle protein [uncultured Hymenobacter sp.]|uniref:PA2169 family four-helix-bundle protein n=1 Tax=uncultured Hymenobacter sp. TaxID=170016 RepID=UPI0035CC4FB0
MKQPKQPNSAGNDSFNASHANSDNTSDSNGAGKLVDQAKQWLNQGSMGDMLTQIQLPKSLKDAGTGALSKVNKLSTTQKVVGGALLAAGVGYLAVRSRKSKSTGQAATLHELLLFVNDRIEGYQRAVDESQDAKLQGYYKQLVSQSQKFATKLNTYLRQQEGSEESGTTLKGKLYRAWMDTKAAVTGADEKAILGSNIYGEEWAIKAYEEALSDNTLAGPLRLEVERQYAQSQKTYKELQKMDGKL